MAPLSQSKYNRLLEPFSPFFLDRLRRFFFLNRRGLDSTHGTAMTVRKQALLSVLLTTALLILVLSLVARIFLLGGFSDLEETQVRQTVERMVAAVASQIDLVGRTASQVASWPEMAGLGEKSHSSSEIASFLENTAYLLGIDAAAVLDSRGRVLFSFWRDKLGKNVPEMPQDFLKAVAEDSRFGDRSKSGTHSGVLLLPEGPMILAASPMHPQAGFPPQAARILVARYVNLSEIERLSGGFPFTLTLSSDESKTVPTGNSCPGLSKWEPVVVKATGPDSLGACGFVTSFSGSNALILRVELPRETYRRGVVTVQWFMLSLLGAGLIFAAVIMFVLDKRIVSRLRDLGAEVSAVAAGGGLTRRVTAAGNDELALLAHEINRMLAALEESESAVKASELRYRAVVEDQTELICRYLPDGTITFANAACAAYLEASSGTLAGRNFFELFAPEGARAGTRGDGLTGPDTPIFSGEESIPGPDGGLRWIHWTGRAIVNGQGEVREIQAVGRDITERKQMEEALKQARDQLEKRVEERTWQLLNTNERLMEEIDQRKLVEMNLRASEERYRTVVEDQTEIICRFLPDWTLTFVNSAYCRYYGKQPEELIGKPIFQLLPHQEGERTIQHLKSLTPENPVIVSEHQVLDANGELRWQQWTDRAIFDESGRLVEFQSVARDITELKEAAKLLRESLTEKEVLLREIHHRVKNNLQVMASLLNLQSDYVENDAQLGIFRDAESRIWSMALVHETLYQSENLALIRVREYVETLAGELLSSYGHLAPGVTLNVDVEDISFGIDTAVPLGLIINELVSNALKHAFPRGKPGAILIRLQSVNEGRFELEVRDNGVGMPASQAHKQEKSFGLHLVKALVRQINGELHVDRSAGTGFVVRFKEVEKRAKR
ncbi:MAG: PAS domain S-box protein [Thermodesulfobacteriota bacterium]